MKWIKCSESLPTDPDTGVWVTGENFMGISEKNFMTTALYDKNEKKWYNDRYVFEKETITHWMHLPPPPNEKDDDIKNDDET